MTRELILIVLVAACAAVILAVLAWAALSGASASFESRLAQIDLDREPFDPDTERAIAQALALPNQAAPLAALHWGWGDDGRIAPGGGR